MKWVIRKDILDRSDLPKDQPFLALWRGSICLCDYDDDDDSFYFVNYPSEYEVSKMAREREPKITHICFLEMPTECSKREDFTQITPEDIERAVQFLEAPLNTKNGEKWR